MGGDEDLAQEILMKGQKFQYKQKPSDSKLFAVGMHGDEYLT